MRDALAQRGRRGAVIDLADDPRERQEAVRLDDMREARAHEPELDHAGMIPACVTVVRVVRATIRAPRLQGLSNRGLDHA